MRLKSLALVVLGMGLLAFAIAFAGFWAIDNGDMDPMFRSTAMQIRNVSSVLLGFGALMWIIGLVTSRSSPSHLWNERT